jgi:hypothetical protein
MGVLVAQALGRPQVADAANGDTVKVGQVKSGSALTQINSSASGIKGRTTGSGTSGLIGESASGSGFGVNGFNTATTGTGIGVRGAASTGGIGVYGNGPRGVVGESAGPSGLGVVGKSNATTGAGSGVRAFSSAPDSQALYAENNAAPGGGVGVAIHATSSTSLTAKVENVSGQALAIGLMSVAPNIAVHGTFTNGATSPGAAIVGDTGTAANTVLNVAGVKGEASKQNHYGGTFRNTSQDGYALRIQGGLLAESCSGVSTVANGTNNVVVSAAVPVYDSTIVLATLQETIGSLAVRNVTTSPNSDQFTIFLNGNAPPGGARVGWIILSTS